MLVRFKKSDFIAIYNAVSKDYTQEKGISGGDRILIELTKKWKGLFRNYEIYTCNSGAAIINDYIRNRKGLKIHQLRTEHFDYNNLFKLYLFKTFKCLIKINSRNFQRKTYLFSSSDFIPDVIPSSFAKIKNNNIKWIAAFYFFAASPFSKEFPYKGIKQILRGILYYLTQKITFFLIRKYADFLVLCNEIDKKIFIKSGYPESRIYVIYGGVDLAYIDSITKPKGKIYDAVYQARFHPQKGPMLAVKAWEQVIKKKPLAKLAMIGNGPLEKEIKDYVNKRNLTNNIKLFGFMDGKEKYQILKSSKIFLHTSIYETGGISPVEGMAAGLPVISFNHKGFKFIYPKGILKVTPVGDYKSMGNAILELLNNQKKYNLLKKQSLKLVKEWDWEKRANQFIQLLNKE